MTGIQGFVLICDRFFGKHGLYHPISFLANISNTSTGIISIIIHHFSYITDSMAIREVKKWVNVRIVDRIPVNTIFVTSVIMSKRLPKYLPIMSCQRLQLAYLTKNWNIATI
jgi:hypothetical protein